MVTPSWFSAFEGGAAELDDRVAWVVEGWRVGGDWVY